MKNTLNILLIAILGLALTACSDKKSKTRIDMYRGDRVGVGGPVSPGAPGSQVSMSTLGYIYNNGGYGGTFQDRVDGFISATNDPLQVLGYVDIQGTGLYFNGQLNLQNGSFNPYGYTNSEIRGGQINLIIFDSVALENGGYGLEIPLGNATGRVNGNQVEITVGDNYGTVTFYGMLSTGGMITGDVSYKNTAHWNGGTPAQEIGRAHV